MKYQISNIKSKIKNIDDLIKIILENRGVKTKKEIEEFLDPKLENVNPKSVGINDANLKKAINRIKLAIKNKEQIVVFGDYDVDGICGSAILWETLNSMNAKVSPYIPHRIDEGYGLSIKGIENLKSKIENCGLIITVDNGIVANKAVEFANKNNIDVIITDHHVAGNTLPNAFAIVHTTKLCGAGVAYLLVQEIKNNREDHLELVALATVADLVPLKDANRVLLKFGLDALRKTKRVGLLELFKEAGLNKNSIGVYEIGHMIAPRLNAMGRLEYAMESLRLICTNNQKRAENLAKLLGDTNRQRQELTMQTVTHAMEKIRNQKSKIKNLLFVSHETYQSGVIGLVAGKLVEQYYRPSIVVSIGKEFSKASARSISGFNIIEFIREHISFLVDAGGHPMAAGFTVETAKLIKLQENLEKRAELLIGDELLVKSLKIDCELDSPFINVKLYKALQKLSPFGIGNPEPTFLSKNVLVENIRSIGKDGKHLKLKLIIKNEELKIIDAIAFGKGEMISKINSGDKIDIVYTIDENEWNGNKTLQLKIKDISL